MSKINRLFSVKTLYAKKESAILAMDERIVTRKEEGTIKDEI